MTQKQVAKNARRVQKEIDASKELLTRLYDAQWQICEECGHEKVVVVRSYYAGNRCYDYDNWHPEVRQCLVCGCVESGEGKAKFKKLLNPIARFEINGDEPGHPLARDGVLKVSLEKVENYVREAGYKVI